MLKFVWITWEKQRRNAFIANAIGAKFFEIIVDAGRLKRYWWSILKTYSVYRAEKPDVIFCQNPSIVLALFSLFYSKLFNVCLCVDTHNAGMALETDSRILKFIARFLQKHSDFIIVTNQALKQIVDNNGGHGLVLPDNIPELKSPEGGYSFKHQHNVVFICTYASDEPYEEVFKAAGQLKSSDQDVGIYVTGKIPPAVQAMKLVDNVHLLGFVSWDDYDKLIFSSDGIIDLTTRENCLVCGAYEGVAAGTPLILSDKQALKDYFTKGVCYSENNGEALYQAILDLINNKSELEAEISDLKLQLSEKWLALKEDLLSEIANCKKN